MISTRLIPGAIMLLLVAVVQDRELQATSEALLPPVLLNASSCLPPTSMPPSSHLSSHLLLRCDAGRMLRVVRVFYGHSATGACWHDAGDCVLNAPASEGYPCIGTDRCDIRLASAALDRRLLPGCQLPSTYVQALYQCIPDERTIDICSTREIQAHSGFLSTPRYPDQYPAGMDCNFSIVAPHRKQRIRLHVIDLVLEANGTDCSDWLQLFDGFHSNTMCNVRARSVRESRDSYMNIRFHSNDHIQQKGFWLYYEAIPYFINPELQPGGAGADTKPSEQPLTRSPGSTTLEPHTVHYVNADQFRMTPGVVYIGIIVGIGLTVLLITILVILHHKRRLHCGCVPLTRHLRTTATAPTHETECKNNVQKARRMTAEIRNAPYIQSASQDVKRHSIPPDHDDLHDCNEYSGGGHSKQVPSLNNNSLAVRPENAGPEYGLKIQLPDVVAYDTWSQLDAV